MDFNTLLQSADIDPATVLVLRHSPKEAALFKVMPWLITDKPSTFNTYQQTQTPRVEKQMSRCKYVAAFFGHEGDKAAFVGLYERKGEKWITREQLSRKPEHKELLKYAVDDTGPERLWFDLQLTDTFAGWQGKLIIRWPKPALVWSRWADKNTFTVDAILEESVFAEQLRDWRDLVFTWDELNLMPKRWKDVLRHWHGVYFIWDEKDRKGYVGSACGSQGIYGRWVNYMKSGHGGNKLLKLRKPNKFQFSILEWTPSDVEESEILRRESLWKKRLHTRAPFGLNDN